MRSAVFLLAVLFVVDSNAYGAPLGRLFYSPGERAQLDTARNDRNRAPMPDTAEEPQSPPPALTYSGLVRRSDGKATVWINNRVVREGELLSGAAVGRIHRDGAISMRVPEAKRAVDLKVGQTLEMPSGSVVENYARPHSVEKQETPKPQAEGETTYSVIKRRWAERDEGAADNVRSEPHARSMGRR